MAAIVMPYHQKGGAGALDFLLLPLCQITSTFHLRLLVWGFHVALRGSERTKSAARGQGKLPGSAGAFACLFRSVGHRRKPRRQGRLRSQAVCPTGFESAQGGLPSPFKAWAVPSARRLCGVPSRRRHFPAEVSLMKTIFWKTLFCNTLLLCAALLIVFGVTRSRAGVNDKKPKEVVNDKNPSERRTLEMVFAIDTTGSMGGLIEGAKQRIWGIVNEVMQSESRPNVRIGLVAYRDRGDRYVTEVFPTTDNLDAVYTTLMDYRAEGGGDTPENVRRALADAVNKAGWSQQSDRIAQVIFLVGDAPPHTDYQDEPDTKATAVAARRKGMIVNAIQCGDISGT